MSGITPVYPWIEPHAQQVSEQRLPMVSLFHGMPGIGLGEYLKQLSLAIACPHSAHLQTCKHCLLAPPPFFYHYPNRVGIDDVRSLEEKLRNHAVSELGARVIWIEDLSQVSIEAQNSLLKMLESPRKEIYFLLQAGLSPILPTIKSRAQIVGFHAPAKTLALEWLNSQGASEALAEWLWEYGGSRVVWIWHCYQNFPLRQWFQDWKNNQATQTMRAQHFEDWLLLTWIWAQRLVKQSDGYWVLLNHIVEVQQSLREGLTLNVETQMQGILMLKGRLERALSFARKRGSPRIAGITTQ